MITGNDIVQEARKWVGTPFGHQGRVLGMRVDCAGLIAQVATALNLSNFDTTDYGEQPHPPTMKAILDRELVPIPIVMARAGDVFWCVYGSKHPRHLAIFTGKNLIHAFYDAGRCVEHRLDTKWHRRIRAAYRYPGID